MVAPTLYLNLFFCENGFSMQELLRNKQFQDAYWKMAARSISNPGSRGEAKISRSTTA